MTQYLTWRNIIFVAGAVGAVAEAIELAQKADVNVTPAHLIAAACVALVGFAAKWPTDVTAAQVKERVARARRESIAPPPGELPTKGQFSELVTRIVRGDVELRDEDEQ